MFVGPNKHFSIVIDEFDGKIVKAWHRKQQGRKEPQPCYLRRRQAHRPRGRQGLPTAHFISRFIPPCMTKP